MPTDVITSLVSAVIGGLLVAVVNYLFARKKIDAEAEKLRAESEKLRAEADRIKAETGKLMSEAGRLGDTVEKATSLISGSYVVPVDESEASKKLTSDVVLAIHSYLRRHSSERASKKAVATIVLPFLKNDLVLAEFVVDSLLRKGFLSETTPGRYEISRLARQELLLGGAK